MIEANELEDAISASDLLENLDDFESFGPSGFLLNEFFALKVRVFLARPTKFFPTRTFSKVHQKGHLLVQDDRLL